MPPRKGGKGRVSAFVDLGGPIFDPDVAERVFDALAEGIEEMAELGADILTQFISQANFVETGSFIGSVESEIKRSRGAGYAVVAPTDVWPAPGRPTRTWFERGTRGGTKMRKANSGFAKTRTRLNAENAGKFFDARVERALN